MPRLIPFFMAGFFVAASGCASVRAQHARNRELAKELADFRFEKPIDEVWQEARLVLVAAGYQLVGADATAVGQSNPNAVARIFSPAHETAPGVGGDNVLGKVGLFKDPGAGGGRQYLDTDWNQYFERYHLDGYNYGDSCRVIFMHVKGDRDHQDVWTRDYEMELDLIRRVDPDTAARMEAGLPQVG